MSKIKVQNISYVKEEYELILSFKEPHYTYGYGYGETFALTGDKNPYDYVEPVTPDYFNVMDINGFLQGVGIAGTEGDSLESYTYGWGYEKSFEIAGNGIDFITVNALVKKNGVAQSGIEVFFDAEPGVIFSARSATTGVDGIASVNVSIDSSVQRNVDHFGDNPAYIEKPVYGFVEIFASIKESSELGDYSYRIATVSNSLFGEDSVQFFSFGTSSYGYGYGMI